MGGGSESKKHFVTSRGKRHIKSKRKFDLPKPCLVRPEFNHSHS